MTAHNEVFSEPLPQRSGLVRRYDRKNPEMLSDEDLLAVPLPVAFWQSLLEGLNNGEFVDPEGAIAERIGDALARSGWLS